jgi:hypothetical protein
MLENCLSGSEGGGAVALPTPIDGLGDVGGVETERKVAKASRLCRGMTAGNLRIFLRARSAY